MKWYFQSEKEICLLMQQREFCDILIPFQQGDFSAKKGVPWKSSAED